MKNILFLFCLLPAMPGWAQTTKQLPSLFSASQIGLLEGAAGSAFMVQTVNGVQTKKWAAGLGIGIDKYKERSVPVFVQVRRSVFEKKVPFFMYADAGINMLWPTRNEVEWQRGLNRDNKPGLYFDAGVQYQFHIAPAQAILISAGYTEKRYGWQTSNPAFCIDGNCPETKNSWQYTYRRIAIKAGWKF